MSLIEDCYPSGPKDVPAGLTAPTRRYRQHAWVATCGLLLFIAAYFGLAAWFAWTSWRLLSGLMNASSDTLIWRLAAGTAAALLAAFLLKALFYVQRGKASGNIEITATEQPVLFAFLYRLADEIRAPRPHRVYLSGGVNAAVFYDLSIANLLLPSRKNLEIGLGLVNVLNLGELKAVLAHEFGHFAQRSMAVGRWVYVAQQIAAQIVARRDVFDRFLNTLSRFDFRIAWLGWILRVIVWSIRSLIGMLFRAVLLAQRALAREMEFQADLVSVSVTGSDALVHALHRLPAAEDAWTRTLAFAGEELRASRPVHDLFTVQCRIIELMRCVFNDARYGSAPEVESERGPGHRLFKAAVAAPPQMWSTHPSNSDREENAKRIYVCAAIDGRDAWNLFTDTATLRERVSSHLLGKSKLAPVSADDTLAQLNARFTLRHFERRYRGVYLGRSIARYARTVDELYEAPSRATIGAIGTLYPQSLSSDVEQLRELEQEKLQLTALRAGQLTAPGSVIRHRGQTLPRKSLSAAIDAVQQELEVLAQRVRGHDRLCRGTHLAAARNSGSGWPEHLKGLLAIHHYADHVEANLRDAQGLLVYMVNHALADRKVSKADLDRILTAASTVYAALKDVHDQVDQGSPGSHDPDSPAKKLVARGARGNEVTGADPTEHRQLAECRAWLGKLNLRKPVATARRVAGTTARHGGSGRTCRSVGPDASQCAAVFADPARVSTAASR